MRLCLELWVNSVHLGLCLHISMIQALERCSSSFEQSAQRNLDLFLDACYGEILAQEPFQRALGAWINQWARLMCFFKEGPFEQSSYLPRSQL